MKRRLGDSLVRGRSTAAAADLASNESETILAKEGKIGPELVVGDALLDALVLADELEEDEASKEVDDESDEEAVSGAKEGSRRVTCHESGGTTR